MAPRSFVQLRVVRKKHGSHETVQIYTRSLRKSTCEKHATMVNFARCTSDSCIAFGFCYAQFVRTSYLSIFGLHEKITTRKADAIVHSISAFFSAYPKKNKSSPPPLRTTPALEEIQANIGTLHESKVLHDLPELRVRIRSPHVLQNLFSAI